MTFKEFVELRKRRSWKTAAIYQRAISEWAKCNDSTPDKLVESIKEGEVDVYDSLSKYASSINGVHAPKSVLTFVGGARQFLGFERIPVDSVIFRSVVGQSLPKKRIVSTHRAPTCAEARQLMLNVKQRTRVALALMLGSGLRIGEVVNLRVENFDFNRDHPTVTINPTDTKSGTMRTVPLTRECRSLLLDYLGDRAKEKKGFLFPQATDPKRHEWRENIYRQVVYGIEKIGLRKKIGKSSRYLVHPHMLRRFFFTACIAAGIDRGLSEYWMGHRFLLDESYLESPETMFEHFRKVEPKLTFLGAVPSDDIRETVETQSVEMRAQTQRIKMLEKQLSDLRQIVQTGIASLDKQPKKRT